LLLINRDEIIKKYGITLGQIGYAVKQKKFPAIFEYKAKREAFYLASEIDQYFIENPVSTPKNYKHKNSLKQLLFESNIPDANKTKANLKIDDFNKMVVLFNIQHTMNRTRKRKVAMHSLLNKYKPVKHEIVKVEGINI
jgi:hypothetical protein